MNYDYESVCIDNTMLNVIDYCVNYDDCFYQILKKDYHDGNYYYVIFNPFDERIDTVKSNATDEFLNRYGSNLTPSSWTVRDKREVRERIEYLFKLPRPPLPVAVDRKAMTAPFVYDGWLFAWQYFPEMKRWELAPLGRR